MIREAFHLRGSPVESIDILLASLTTATLRQYDVGLKKWWLFSKKNNISWHSATPKQVLTFLTNQFREGASHGTLNSFRSSISLVIGTHIGEDEIIKRFFKGVFHIRPTRPKFTCTWDPSIVLNLFNSLEENHKLPLSTLTEKLATLLALVTAQRVQTLSLIDIADIKQNNSVITINVAARLKTSGPNRYQPQLQLPTFAENSKICPVNALLVYLERTKQHRNSSFTNLLITYKKPYKAASTQTISRWIKNILKRSGLDTSIFTAHSTRHAASSKAAQKGVDIDTIRRAAGWTETSSTFANFYHRPLGSSNTVASAILNER